MVYQIDNKYYVNISPRIYVEVLASMVNGEVVLTPTKNKVEVTQNTDIQLVDIKQVMAKTIDNKAINNSNRKRNKNKVNEE